MCAYTLCVQTGGGEEGKIILIRNKQVEGKEENT